MRGNRSNSFNRFRKFNGGYPKDWGQGNTDSIAESVFPWQFSRFGGPNIARLSANDKDFSLSLEMTTRESDVS